MDHISKKTWYMLQKASLRNETKLHNDISTIFAKLAADLNKKCSISKISTRASGKISFS